MPAFHTRLERVRTDDGVSIAYEVSGSGSRALLALHGWGGCGSGHSWREVIRHMDLRDLRVIAIDLRGHGESDRPEIGFTLERFGQDILAVADHCGIERLAMAGFSMSGRWSQWISCQYPERVTGQALIAPAPAVPLQLSDELVDSWILLTRSRESFEPWLNQFTSEKLAVEVVDGYFSDVSRASEFAKRETLRMCCRDDFSELLGSTQAATLVVAGTHDPMLSPDFLRREVASRIPRARLVQVDCGHEIPVERPAQTAALIEAFLAGLPG